LIQTQAQAGISRIDDIYHAEITPIITEQTRANRTLMHPYLVSLRHIMHIRNSWLLILDACGGTVGKGALLPTQAAQLALALHYLHGRGFIHGSVRADNVHYRLYDNGSVTLSGGLQTISRVPLNKGAFEAADWFDFGHVLKDLGRNAARDVLLADLVKQLTCDRIEDRLGLGPSGFQRIKAHAYFASVNWDSLLEVISMAAQCTRRTVVEDDPKDCDEYDWCDAVLESSDDMLMPEQVLRNSYGNSRQ